MDNYERINLLEQASGNINEAIGMIQEALKGTGTESNAEAYIIAHLKNWANGGNPYDMTIPKMIEEIENGKMDNMDECEDDDIDNPNS